MNIEPNIKNREFYLINNLDVMRGINTGTVKVIATDPPFKTDRAWASTPSDMKSQSSGRFDDRWPWIVDLDATALWLQSNAPGVWRFIEYAYEYWGESMGSFLTYMGVRAVEMHRIYGMMARCTGTATRKPATTSRLSLTRSSVRAISETRSFGTMANGATPHGAFRATTISF